MTNVKAAAAPVQSLAQKPSPAAPKKPAGTPPKPQGSGPGGQPFTGEKKDKLGRRICFNEGIHVECPKKNDEGGKDKKEPREKEPPKTHAQKLAAATDAVTAQQAKTKAAVEEAQKAKGTKGEAKAQKAADREIARLKKANEGVKKVRLGALAAAKRNVTVKFNQTVRALKKANTTGQKASADIEKLSAQLKSGKGNADKIKQKLSQASLKLKDAQGDVKRLQEDTKKAAAAKANIEKAMAGSVTPTPKPAPKKPAAKQPKFPPDKQERNSNFYPEDDKLPSYLKDSFASISEKGQKGVLRYTGSAYDAINMGLKYGEMNPNFHKTVEDLDKVFQSAKKLPEPITVWRGIQMSKKDATSFTQKFMDDIKSGNEMQWDRYTSTSLDPEVADSFTSMGSQMLFEISTDHGIYVGENSHVDNEREFLLPRSSKFKPIGIKEVMMNGEKRRVMQMQHVGDDSAKRPIKVTNKKMSEILSSHGVKGPDKNVSEEDEEVD